MQRQKRLSVINKKFRGGNHDEGKKQWGYFSKRDGEIHSFLLCEDCYDEMVKKFVIPPMVTEATEL